MFTTALSTEGVMLVRSDGMVPMRVVRCGVIHRHGRHLRHKGRCIVASLPVSGVKEDALHAHRLACFSMVCSLSSIFSPYPSVQSGFWAGGRLTRPHTHASTISESLDSSPAGFGLAGLQCWRNLSVVRFYHVVRRRCREWDQRGSNHLRCCAGQLGPIQLVLR